MTALAQADPRVTRLLDRPEAADLTRALVVRLGAAAPELPEERQAVGEPAGEDGRAGARAAFLREALSRLRGLAESLTTAGGGGADTADLSRAAPWLAAALFARSPAVCRLPPTLILDLIAQALAQWAGAPPVGRPHPASDAAGRPGPRQPAVAGRPDQEAAAVARPPVDTGPPRRVLRRTSDWPMRRAVRRSLPGACCS